MCFSTSWPQDGFPTRSGTVCSTSWPRWWGETRRSSATPRRDASLPNSSPLSTCGEETFCSMMTDLLKWKICPLVDEQLNCLLLINTLLVSSLFKPYKGRVKKAKVQRATGEFTLASLHSFFILTWRFLSFYWRVNLPSPLQKDPFIQMYEERSVDVAGYVCRLLDQMPASPSSPMYMDW